MDTAIIYATTHGTTEKVAHKLQNKLGSQNTMLFNIKTNKDICIENFEKVIIGGSIHAGMIQNGIKNFCKKHEEKLLQKHLGLFICGMNVPEYQAQLEKAFPESLRKHAKTIEVMGGEFLFEKMNFFQKLIVKKISGIKDSVSKIDESKINKFIQEFQQ